MTLTFEGVHEDGKKLGRQIGFPTINLHVDDQLFEEIPQGVYLGRIKIENKNYFAAVNFGGRPTIDKKLVCELFVFDFDNDLTAGRSYSVELIKKIRDIKKFENVAALKKQINLDVETMKKMISSL